MSGAGDVTIRSALMNEVAAVLVIGGPPDIERFVKTVTNAGQEI